MNPILFNGICYTIGWMACVICGSYNQEALAFLLALFFIIIQLINIYKIKPEDFKTDLYLMLISIPSGILFEILIAYTGIVKYHDHTSVFPPVWIIVIYPLFALFMNHCLRFLKQNRVLPLIFGFIGAPPSYFGGASIGAAIILTSSYRFWIILGLFWSLYLFFLTEMSKKLDSTFKQ